MAEQTPEGLRASYAMMAALDGEPIPLAGVEDRTIPGPAGEIPVRIYTPEGSGPFPVVVFFHGGGLRHRQPRHPRRAGPGAGRRRQRRRRQRRLPAGARAPVPRRARRLLRGHAVGPSARGRAGRRSRAAAVAGDSAGGNLAAVIAVMARRRRAAAAGPDPRVPRHRPHHEPPVDRGERRGLPAHQGRWTGSWATTGKTWSDGPEGVADARRRTCRFAAGPRHNRRVRPQAARRGRGLCGRGAAGGRRPRGNFTAGYDGHDPRLRRHAQFDPRRRAARRASTKPPHPARTRSAT